jgi:DUF971 family protein
MPQRFTPHDATAVPIELRVVAAGKGLAIKWSDRDTVLLAARVLREACRCAACTAERADGVIGAPEADPTIVSVEPIGSYAINIGFSDGHARGVYPWGFLRELGAR